MDAFLAPLSLIFSHSATALLLQIMNRLTQKSIHSGFTFVIKQSLNHIDKKNVPPEETGGTGHFMISFISSNN